MDIMKLPVMNCYPATTLGDFFKQAMVELWVERESFSGKRPLGDSDWQHNIAIALIEAGVVMGDVDEYGEAHNIKWADVDRMILEAIQAWEM